jgi:hypothetical protein
MDWPRSRHGRTGPDCERRTIELLAAGLSQREVARELGINKNTVNAIAKRWSDGPRPSSRTPPGYARCPTCGGMVQMPCRRCELERQLGTRSK